MSNVELFAREATSGAKRAVDKGDLRAAVDILELALARFQRLGKTAADSTRQTMMVLAMLYRDLCETDMASDYLERALAHVRNKAQEDIIRLRKVFLIPPISRSVSDIYDTRNRLERRLKQVLETDLCVANPLRDIPCLHFYLAYHGLDDRPLLELQSDVFRKVSPFLSWVAPDLSNRADKSLKMPLKIGFFSALFRDHTIGRLSKGILSALPSDVFAKTLIGVCGQEDEFTRSMAEDMEDSLYVSQELNEARMMIAEKRFDILYFADIGMEPLSYFLAFSRMAPLQVTTWGHPVTSGIGTIDCFILGSDMEPSEGDVHFTEKLIRLKSPNIVFDRPEPIDERPERDVFDLPRNRNLYLCPQALYKFHPDFDPVLGKILRRDPFGILVIIRSRYGAWDEIFMERLSAHLDHPDRQIVMLPPMSRDKYLSLLRLGDVMLDPFPFCGGHTSLEALSFGVPVVTLPTGHTRGRLTYAFYRTFEMLDCVCNNPREYVELAVKLGTDRQANHKMRRKILKVCGILFKNEGVVDDLADALIERLEDRFNGAGPSLQKARPYN